MPVGKRNSSEDFGIRVHFLNLRAFKALDLPVAGAQTTTLLSMEFLFPGFLWALLAVAIPLVIHLFHFRRFKRVYFTNVRFLREVKEETAARQRLRNLLVLAMRMLAVAALALAFAQPIIPLGRDLLKGQKAVSIFVDNSFSMSAMSEDVPLLELARRKAKQIVEAYAVDDQFQILTHAFEGRHQRMVGKEEALSLIDEIERTPVVHRLDQILLRQQQALERTAAPHRVAWVLSDFQASIVPDALQPPDTGMQVQLVPLQSVQEQNVAIDSAWFESPVQMLDQTNLLFVRLHNYGNDAAENVRLSLRYGGEKKPVGTLSVPARSTVIDTIPLTVRSTGWHEAVLEITDFPVQFDDQYFVTFYVEEQVDVLLITEERPDAHLMAALEGLPHFKTVVKLAGKLDYSIFPSFEFIVLQEPRAISSGLAFALSEFVKQGGNVLLFPSAQADAASYNAFLRQVGGGSLGVWEPSEQACSFINTDEFVFRDVFENRSAPLRLPTSTGWFRLQAAPAEEVLLRYRNGAPYLVKYTFEAGRVYLCASPLDVRYNDLVRQGEIFVPMLYKMAIAANTPQRLAWTIGKDEYIEFPNALKDDDLSWKIRGPDTEFIPEQRLVGGKLVISVRDYLDKAGVYELVDEEGQFVAQMAFNYDRTESDLSLLRLPEIETRFGSWATIINAWTRADFRVIAGAQAQGIRLWKWFVLLALLALLIEELLLRFWKD